MTWLSDDNISQYLCSSELKQLWLSFTALFHHLFITVLKKKVAKNSQKTLICKHDEARNGKIVYLEWDTLKKLYYMNNQALIK